MSAKKSGFPKRYLSIAILPISFGETLLSYNNLDSVVLLSNNNNRIHFAVLEVHNFLDEFCFLNTFIIHNNETESLLLQITEILKQVTVS